MKSRSFLSRTGAMSLLMLSLAAAAAASETARAEGGHESAAWQGLAFSFVNFSIFLFLLRRYAWPATGRRGPTSPGATVREPAWTAPARPRAYNFKYSGPVTGGHCPRSFFW